MTSRPGPTATALRSTASTSPTISALDVGEANSGAILTLDDGTTVIGGGVGTLTINANNTLDIEAGASPGSGATLDGVNLTDNGALQIDNSVTLLVDGTTTIDSSGDAGMLTDNGTLEVDGGALTVGGTVTIGGSGSFLISNGGVADFLGAFNQNVTFSGGGTFEFNPSLKSSLHRRDYWVRGGRHDGFSQPCLLVERI